MVQCLRHRAPVSNGGRPSTHSPTLNALPKIKSAGQSCVHFPCFERQTACEVTDMSAHSPPCPSYGNVFLTGLPSCSRSLSLSCLLLYRQHDSSTAFRLNLMSQTRHIVSEQSSAHFLSPVSSRCIYIPTLPGTRTMYQNLRQQDCAQAGTPAWNIFLSHPFRFHLRKPHSSFKVPAPSTRAFSP